jgi:hypothetical protein
MRVDGTASDASGSPLAVGARIRADVDGVDASNGSAVLDAGGTFSVLVDGNSHLGGASDSPTVKEGADPGEAIVFAAVDASGVPSFFEETIAWDEGTTRAQDLGLAAGSAQPAPVRIQALLPRPAQGGPQVAFVCNPASAAVDLGAYYVELNRPGAVHGPRFNLTGVVNASETARIELGSSTFLNPTGDAVKLVFSNPGGTAASGRDIVLDRIEYNATAGGTLSWEPGNTLLPDAPAPRPGYVLERESFCADTDQASDFRLSQEPGLPPNGPPTVAVVEPVAGAVLQGGAPFTIRWTMDDDVFLPEYLVVWVNVSVGGTNISVLAAAEGALSVVWNVPDQEVSGARVHVDVEDPFGGRANATSGPISISRTPPLGDLALLIAGILIAVIFAFLLLAFLLRRRGAQPSLRPAGAPPPAVPPPAAPVPPSVPEAPGGERKKACPRCGTAVSERDWTCFFCGYRFPGPP